VKPDAPEPPKPDRITRDSVTLSWRPPRNDGGSKIKGYIIQKKGKDDKDWSDVNGTPVPVNVFKVNIKFHVKIIPKLAEVNVNKL
jgi:Fibronectin type III domain.